MPAPQFDWEKGSYFIAFMSGLIAFVTWPYKTFITKKAADATFVKKVEADGTQTYVHAKQWEEMRGRLDESIEQGKKWQEIAQKWIDTP